MNYTRDSLLWGWRRAAEYFRSLFEMDHTKEVYELMANYKKKGLLKVEALLP